MAGTSGSRKQDLLIHIRLHLLDSGTYQTPEEIGASPEMAKAGKMKTEELEQYLKDLKNEKPSLREALNRTARKARKGAASPDGGETVKVVFMIDTEELVLSKVEAGKKSKFKANYADTLTMVDSAKDLHKFNNKELHQIFNGIVPEDKKLKGDRFKTKKEDAAVRVFEALKEHHTPEDAKKSDKPKRKGAKVLIRELLTETAEGLTIEELILKTGVGEVTLRTALTDLKNPKYAGKAGVLNIVKDKETKKFQIQS